MLLKEYLRKTMREKSDLETTQVLSIECVIMNCETGEIYFSGNIDWIAPEFVSDKLIFDSKEENSRTILVKEVK